MKVSGGRRRAAWVLVSLFLLSVATGSVAAQSASEAAIAGKSSAKFTGETTQSLNDRLAALASGRDPAGTSSAAQDYRIGPEDLLSISVFEAPELGREVRVSTQGQISLPLVGEIHASGLTPRQLEAVLEELLRRTIMKDPHVNVFVKEMESHSVSVFGAVKKPGVFQIRAARSLIEVLSLAEGLADDAGDTVIVMRHDEPRATAPANASAPRPAESAGPAGDVTSDPSSASPPAALTPSGKSMQIDLRDLLSSGDPRFNVPIYPGDVVKVTRAGIVYVVGEVGKPGGYLLKTNESVSILQAIALAGGLTHTSAGGRARIIRTEGTTGERREIPVNVSRILQGKDSDQILQAKDIVFIPNSAGKAALYRSTEGIAGIVGSALIYRY